MSLPTLTKLSRTVVAAPSRAGALRTSGVIPGKEGVLCVYLAGSGVPLSLERQSRRIPSPPGVGWGDGGCWLTACISFRRIRQRAIAWNTRIISPLLVADLKAVITNLQPVLVATGFFSQPEYIGLLERAKEEMDEMGATWHSYAA